MNKTLLLFSRLLLVIIITISTQIFAEESSSEKEALSKDIVSANDEITEDDSDLFDLPIEELMEIEVVSTATLTEASPRLVPAAVTTITAEQIRASQARSLYELLDIYVPNLQWMRHHWEADVMGLRGILTDRDDKYLLLVNGRNMNQRTHFGALSEQDLVMLSDIHHIDVVRGPGSALYGPGAVAMVINIVTFNAETFEGTDIISHTGAIEEFYAAEMRHTEKFDDGGGLFLFGGIGHYPGADKQDAPMIFPIDYPTTSDYPWAGSPPPHHGPPAYSLPGDWIREGDPITHLDLNGDGASARDLPPIKLHAQLTKDNWDIWARYTRGGKKFEWSGRSLFRHPAGWADWNNMWWDSTALIKLPMFDCFYSYQQTTGFIGYQHELNENVDMDYAFSYDMFDFDRFADNRIFDAYREDEYYGKVLMRWDPNNGHRIAVGTEVSHLELGMKGVGYPDALPLYMQSNPMPRWSTNLYSVFGEHQWNINDKWTTFVGTRLDDHTYTDLMFSPRAAIVHTPNEKDTWKLMWARSVRSNFEEEMKAQALDPNTGDNSEPEKLDSIELRLERQQNRNLDLAASVFVHYNLEIISWNNTSGESVPVGTQRDYGIELEAVYHTERTRIRFSHGYTKLYDFYLEPGQSTYITAKPYGFGNDLTNWSNHITKITAQHQLNDQWTLDASLRVYWGFPGMKDYDEYYPYSTATPGQTYGDGTPYPTLHRIVDPGWERSYRGNYYLNLGLQYKPSDRLIVGVMGYNLLGIFNKDFNKRNYLDMGEGNYRSHTAAVGIYALYRCK